MGGRAGESESGRGSRSGRERGIRARARQRRGAAGHGGGGEEGGALVEGIKATRRGRGRWWGALGFARVGAAAEPRAKPGVQPPLQPPRRAGRPRRGARRGAARSAEGAGRECMGRRRMRGDDGKRAMTRGSSTTHPSADAGPSNPRNTVGRGGCAGTARAGTSDSCDRRVCHGCVWMSGFRIIFLMIRQALKLYATDRQHRQEMRSRAAAT